MSKCTTSSNFNDASSVTKFLFKVLLLGMLLFGLFLAGQETYRVAAWPKVKATVSGYSTATGRNKPTGNSVAKFIQYDYEYNGKPYTGERQVTSVMFVREGKKEKIHVDPKDPKKIDNPMDVTYGLLFGIESGIFSYAF